jgi:leucyl-tRNA synthetase
MAVPAHDSRDFAFARHFDLPVVQVIVPKGEEPEGTATWKESKDSKEGTCIHSDFINGMPVKEAISTIIKKIEALKLGYGTVNYRLRDAIFSRQRYWGEPFPIYYKEGIPCPIAEKDLPLRLPEVDKYLPTETGEPPLARAKNWIYNGYPLDCNTMPGFAGSNAYYLRYMDPDNEEVYVGKQANEYWGNVDLYMGGSEHATGHLLYSRMWNKFLFDIGVVSKDEPFQRLINQGMIQGRTSFAYRERGTNRFISLHLKDNYQTDPIRIDVNLTDNDVLDLEGFKNWRPEFINAEFVLENGKYICGYEIEKMSKSYYNVQNPDDLVEKYGADTLRMYEMFLGPIEQSKPWNVQGIEGVARFIRKFWKLYHSQGENDFCISEETPSLQELKILHKTIKKIQEDIECFSFNTSVSAFMICVNELTELKSNKRMILEPLCILISSFAPHISEEIWQLLGQKESISYALFPIVNEEYLQENTVVYPVSFNGKTRFMMEFGVNTSSEEIEKDVLQSPEAQRWLEGKTPKKIIIVPKKIINIVI